MIDDKSLFKEEEKDTQFIKQVYRAIGSYLAALLSKTKITPNHVSVFSVLTGLVSAYLFSTGDRPLLAIGAVLLQVSLIADYTDGCLARKKGMVTFFGDWLDYNSDLLIGSAVFLGLSYGAYRTHASFTIWVLGTAAMALWHLIIGMYTSFKKYDFAGKVSGDNKKKFAFLKQFLYTHAFIYALVSIGALLGMVYEFMWAIAVYSLAFYLAFAVLLGKNILKYQQR